MPQTRIPENFHDILIAGGGPVGMVLALALARRGFNCAAADSGVAAPGRAYFISHGCWRVFDALGLGDALSRDAEAVTRVDATGPVGGISFLGDGAGPGANADGALGYMVSAATLSAALLDAARATSGVTLLPRARVTHIEFADPAVTATFDGGEQVRARLIVGCDGARSLVRQAAGVAFEGRDYGAKAVSATLKLAAPHDGAARQVFLKSGPIALLPLTGNRANLVWTHKAAVADALVAMSNADFAAELAKQADGFIGGFDVEGARAAFPISLRVADRFHGPRMALAGDAAHLVHPLAGQGLNLGLKDAAALVDVIAEAMRVGLDIGSEAALAPYTLWRRADVVATAAAMEGFALAFTAPAPVRIAAGLAMGAAGQIKPLRDMFAREAGGVLGELPSLMRA